MNEEVEGTGSSIPTLTNQSTIPKRRTIAVSAMRRCFYSHASLTPYITQYENGHLVLVPLRHLVLSLLSLSGDRSIISLRLWESLCLRISLHVWALFVFLLPTVLLVVPSLCWDSSRLCDLK